LANYTAEDVKKLREATQSDSLEAFLASTMSNGSTVQATVDEANATMGEKIEVRRIAVIKDSPVGIYLHRTSPDLPPQVGVLVELVKDAAEVGKDIAQHIAAFAPQFVNREDVPADLIENERRIAEETAREEGKPEASLSKIIEGRVTGFVKEVSLIEQSFAKDAKKTVKQILDEAGTAVKAFQKGIGVDPDVVQDIARQIADVARSGVQVAIVVGGGNYFRGAELSQRGMDRSRADYMGMLGTVMNCLALQDFLEKEGVATRVQTAITMGQVAEPYIPLRAIRHLEKGRVVIFGAGAGMPFFTTDTVSAQRALEIGAEALLLAKSGVDGVYSADPKKDPQATKYDTITYNEVLSKSLAVADAAAFALCRENKLPIVVFDLMKNGNIGRAVRGEVIGTLVA
jgi:uridylate kinase